MIKAILIILIVLAVIAAILLVKFSLIIEGAGASFSVTFKVLFFKKRIYPKKTAKKSAAGEPAPKAEHKTKLTPAMIKEKYLKLKSVLEGLKKIVRKYFSHIVLEKGKINIVVSAAEAYETALSYAAVSSAVYGAAGVFNSMVNIKKLDVNVMPDFLIGECKSELYLQFSARLFYNISALWSLAVLAFKNKKLLKKELFNN